eukprot:Gb_23505 [translate_table: standard]
MPDKMDSAKGDFFMPAIQLQANSSAKGRTARLFVLYIMVLAFSIPVILLPFAIRRLQLTVEFIFLVLTPSVWTSLTTWLRPPYLYVVLNVVIVTLGVKSGVLSSSNNENSIASIKLYSYQSTPISNTGSIRNAPENDNLKLLGLPSDESEGDGLMEMQPISEKCEENEPFSSHLIAMDHAEADEMHLLMDVPEEDEDEEEEETLSAEELFEKSEVFIGNFYRDLKLQRQDSLKRIHGLYADTG